MNKFRIRNNLWNLIQLAYYLNPSHTGVLV